MKMSSISNNMAECLLRRPGPIDHERGKSVHQLEKRVALSTGQGSKCVQEMDLIGDKGLRKIDGNQLPGMAAQRRPKAFEPIHR